MSAPEYGKNFETPQGAILCLEDAYRANDLDAAVRCKDFRLEARLLLENLKNARDIAADDELLDKTAEVLELAYRKEVTDNGFPDMGSTKCRFTDVQPHSEGVVVVTEVCQSPDGGTSTQGILVGKTDRGWRVLNPVK